MNWIIQLFSMIAFTIGGTLYCIRTKTFLFYPGMKKKPYKMFEGFLYYGGLTVFIMTLLFDYINRS